MRILFVHNYYKIRGGEDKSFEMDVEILKTLGHQVFLYMRKNNETSSFSIVEKLLFPLNALYSRKSYREVDELIDRISPHVAIIQNVFPLISPSVYDVLYKRKVPVFQSIRNFRFFCVNGTFHDGRKVCELCPRKSGLFALMKRCYRNSYSLSAIYSLSIWLMKKRNIQKKIHKFIVLNEFVLGKFSEFGISESKLVIKPNFINSVDYQLKGSEKRYVLFVGSLLKHKGVHTLIRAFTRTVHNDLKLVIIGEGPEKNDLQSMVPEEFKNRIHFKGFCDGEEKEKWIRECMFLVVSSECYENFPRTILEAFSHKKPVITTNLGGLPILVEHHQNGLIYEPGNDDELKEHIEYLVGNPQSRAFMGENNFKACKSRYSFENVLKITSEIFQSEFKEN